MSTLFGGGNPGRELPKPRWVTTILGVFAFGSWVMGIAALAVFVWALAAAEPPLKLQWNLFVGGLIVFAAYMLVGAVALGFSLIVKYTFSTAVSAKLTERTMRDFLQKRVMARPEDELGGSASHEEVVSLLAEIMENTLLDDKEKGAKRQLAKKHRQQALRREIEALINAAKYREAEQRLEEFRIRYADSSEVNEMQARLAEALGQHEQSEAAHISEQVERYMSLGLWERALDMAKRLAEQYPGNADAAHLPETVRLEQQAHRREEQQRLYKEIEHLASRRHWQEAIAAARTLLQNHPDSPEAHALEGQMEELERNAAIMERREWEARIAEHVQAGRHREAYDLAVELMKKYPDSPQADAIRQRLDQLKMRAGIAE